MSQAPQEQTPSGRVDLDAKLEAEIEAALGDMTVEDMLDIGEKPKQPSTSSERVARTGKVVSIRAGDVFVEFGPRSQGVCPLAQFEAPPEIGQQLPFVVERLDEADGLLILSREGAVQKADWDSLEIGQVVEGRCIGMIKGGLEVQLGSHKAFLPASQVDVHFMKDISVLLQEKIQAEVIELNKRRGRVVLSRKKVLEVEREKRRRDLMSSIEVGKQMTAVITSVQPYGAFADIGGVDGLIHVSDMAYQRISKPDEVVKEGDQVKVQVLKVDTKQRPPRISLGMKQCIADPFETKADELEAGAQVSGKVTRIMPFGAFVEIAPGVEGLIHISELAHERVNKVEHVVKADEVVTCQVLSVDPSARRISLSLKALKERPQHDGRGGGDDDAELSRADDPMVKKLRAQLSKKFGDNLKGGIG